MADNTTEHAVISMFNTPGQAEQAANDLLDWQKTNTAINFGAIGVVTKNNKGELQSKNYAERNTGKGARIGVGLGVLAAVLSGGLSLIPTAIGGAIAGAAAGALSHKALGLTDAEKNQLNSDLDRGCAAILVMCDESEVGAITDYLTLEGGRTLSHPVDSASLESAAKVAESDSESEKPANAET
jgi:uncharacterized membrane protein